VKGGLRLSAKPLAVKGGYFRMIDIDKFFVVVFNSKFKIQNAKF